MKGMTLYVAHLCKSDHVIVYYCSLMHCVGEVLSALRGDGNMVAGTNECLSSVQQRKEEARRKRRKKKRTGSSLVSSCFQGMGWGCWCFWSGDQIFAALVSEDAFPVKHCEKMLSLTFMSFQQNIRDFVWVLCCFIYHTAVISYVMVNTWFYTSVEQSPWEGNSSELFKKLYR